MAQDASRFQAAEGHRAEVETVLTQFKDLLTQRDTMQADKQVLSQELKDTGRRLVDATIDLKYLLKALVGSTSDKVTEFQMKPRRKVVVSDPKPRREAAEVAGSRPAGRATRP